MSNVLTTEAPDAVRKALNEYAELIDIYAEDQLSMAARGLQPKTSRIRAEVYNRLAIELRETAVVKEEPEMNFPTLIELNLLMDTSHRTYITKVLRECAERGITEALFHPAMVSHQAEEELIALGYKVEEWRSQINPSKIQLKVSWKKEAK